MLKQFSKKKKIYVETTSKKKSMLKQFRFVHIKN